METITINIQGMSCAVCAKRIERKLSVTAGVASAQVDLAAAKATVSYDAQVTNAAALAGAVESLGFIVVSS